MGRIEIFWTRTAFKQRNAVFSFWNKRNGNSKYSNKLRLQLNNRIKQLSSFPLSGKESAHYNTRVAAMEHYSIFYRFENDRIIVMAFWDNRQDPDKLLEILKNKG